MTNSNKSELDHDSAAVVQLIETHIRWGPRGRDQKWAFERRLRDRLENNAPWWRLGFGTAAVLSGGVAGAACVVALTYVLIAPVEKIEPRSSASFLVAAYYGDGGEVDTEDGEGYLTPELRIWSDSLEDVDRGES